MEAEAFPLTKVPCAKVRQPDEELLSKVHEEHTFMMDVVRNYERKVDLMVEKQRIEYMQAYENHMQDVQKELYFLREKVNEIANDLTKEEKIKTLEADQKFYRNEALMLDSSNNELRKKLRVLTSRMRSVERERDWLLKKLRRAKNQFQMLKTENDQLRGDVDAVDGGHQDEISLDSASLSMTSLSQDSSYILDIHQRNVGRNLAPITGGDMSNNGGFMVSRDQSLLSAVPRLMSGNFKDRTSYDKGSVYRYPTNGPDGRLRPAITKQQRTDTKSLHERRAVGELVSLRARQEALRDLVDQCARSCDRGPWAKAKGQRRPLPQLLHECMELLVKYPHAGTSTSTSSGRGDALEAAVSQRRRELAMQLAASQETYFALSDIFAGKFVDADEEINITSSAKANKKPENQDHAGKTARDANTSDVLRAVDSFFAEEQQALRAAEEIKWMDGIKSAPADHSKQGRSRSAHDDDDADVDDDEEEDGDEDDEEDEEDDEDYSGDENEKEDDNEAASVDGSELSGPDDINE